MFELFQKDKKLLKIKVGEFSRLLKPRRFAFFVQRQGGDEYAQNNVFFRKKFGGIYNIQSKNLGV